MTTPDSNKPKRGTPIGGWSEINLDLPLSRYKQRVTYQPTQPRIRHVWVEQLGRHGSPDPGIVIEWRYGQATAVESGWYALVAYIGAYGGLRVDWVKAEYLLPVRDPSALPPSRNQTNVSNI